MRVVCNHGFFRFYPRDASDISLFNTIFEKELVHEKDYFTFSELIDAPKHSLVGLPYINLPALSTFEGEPWEVMKENDFVYNIATGLLVPKLSILTLIDPAMAGYYFICETALLQPGSRNALGQQILSYDGEFIFRTNEFRLRSLSYE